MTTENLQIERHIRDVLGGVVGPSAWRTVTQEQIDTFARLTGDHQWIHVDVERARRESPFGTTIAHGNLTLSLVDGFRDELNEGLGIGDDLVGVNYGYERVRFPAAVPSGARVRATAELIDVAARDVGWVSITQRYVVEVEGAAGKPACVADSVVLVRARP
jgi:acyl dehydratase